MPFARPAAPRWRWRQPHRRLLRDRHPGLRLGCAARLQRRRLPEPLLLAGVVALVVLMAGFGTAFAVLANRGGSNPSGGVGSLPSPSPASSASPVASPTAAPTYGATTASNDGLSVPVPQGWAVANKDSETIVLSDPNGEGSVSLGSGPSSPAQTAQENKATIDNYLKSTYPDARACPSTAATRDRKSTRL